MKTHNQHIFLALCIIALVGVHSDAQGRGKTNKKASKKVAQELQTDISFLASDELAGRRTGTEGERKACAYIIARYKKLGIEPYNYNYRYPFHFIYGKEIAPASTIQVDSRIVSIPDEAFPLPFSASKHINSDAMINPDIKEQGSIWLLPLYADQSQADNANFEYERYMFEYARDAARQGAAGVVFYDSYGGKCNPEFGKKSELETLDIPAVYFNHDAYVKYFKNTDGHGSKTSFKIDLNAVINKIERNGTNVAAYIDNHAPYTVVIGGHYDHLGFGEDGNSLYANAAKEHQIHHGADDNASGTAAVMQVAQWINERKKELNHYNYLFLNFSGEELGLYGSKAFAKEENLDSNHIAYMINMDMVGRLNDSTNALTLGGVGTSPRWTGVVAKGNEQFKLTLDSSGIGPSDHTTFYNLGIPVLFLFTGTHKDYHKPSDVATLINYPGEAKVIAFCEDIIETLDVEHLKPAFTVTKATSTGGRSKYKVTLGIMPDYSYSENGMRIDGVMDGRPGANAGLKQGDIILQLGNVKVQGMQSYMEALSKLSPGEKTNVTINRGGKEMVLPVEMNK